MLFTTITMRKVAREVRLSKWAEIIRKQKVSGQSIHEWCAANSITKQQYFYWQRQLRGIACESLATQSGSLPPVMSPFTEITRPAEISPAGTITIRIGAAVVEIAGDASPSAIEAIMRMLINQC